MLELYPNTFAGDAIPIRGRNKRHRGARSRFAMSCMTIEKRRTKVEAAGRRRTLVR